MGIPELNGKSFIHVEIKLNGQTNWRNGIFYLNGGRPSFASYGSDVTDKVTEWKYKK